MSKILFAEDSPAKLVLEKSFTAVEIWRERGRSFINPLVVLAVLYIGINIYSSNNSVSPTRLYWVVGIGVAIAEIIALYTVLYAKRKITITIDLHSKIASRNIIFISGKEQKSETALGNVSRVVLHHYNEQRGSQLELDVSDQSNFIIATYSDFLSDDSLVEALKSLESLGKKIGELLQKPVVKKLTEVDVNETVISEEVIQP